MSSVKKHEKHCVFTQQTMLVQLCSIQGHLILNGTVIQSNDCKMSRYEPSLNHKHNLMFFTFGQDPSDLWTTMVLIN